MTGGWRARIRGEPEAGTPADGVDGNRGDLSEAQADGSRAGTTHLSVSAGRTEIDRPNQVWCTDITYIRMRQGFMYLVAVMDWFSRYVLAWEVSVSLETSFCLAALDWAFRRDRQIFSTPIKGRSSPAKISPADWRVTASTSAWTGVGE